LSQQTPSAQKPLTHCPAREHAVPFESPAMHAPALHWNPFAQSPSTAHVVLHEPVVHLP
jgi:hypothetical protein